MASQQPCRATSSRDAPICQFLHCRSGFASPEVRLISAAARAVPNSPEAGGDGQFEAGFIAGLMGNLPSTPSWIHWFPLGPQRRVFTSAAIAHR